MANRLNFLDAGPLSYGSAIGITQRLQHTTRPVLHTLEHMLQAIYGVTALIDAAYIAAISSGAALSSFYGRAKGIALLKNLRHGWIFSRLFKSSHRSTWTTRAIVTSIAFLLTVGLLKAIQLTVRLVLAAFSLPVDEPPNAATTLVTLSKPIFAKAMFDFVPEAGDTRDLALLSGDLVAILKVPAPYILPIGTVAADSLPNATLDVEALMQRPIWLLGRTRDGRSGLFPSNYIQLISPSRANA
jgi:hypothetical protein